ncbi:hypothetical protein Tco_0737639, partial [Tanacetum coccineum]
NYEVTREEKAKRRNFRTKMKTFEESTKTTTIRRIQQGRYGVSPTTDRLRSFLGKPLNNKVAIAASDLNETYSRPLLPHLYLTEQNSNKHAKIGLSGELIMKLRDNAYDGAETNDTGYDNDTLDYDEESSDDEYSNGDNHPFFNHHQNDNDKSDENGERNDHSNRPENFVRTDAPQSSNDKPNKRMCRMDKFEVIKYSVEDNEEFLEA